MKQEPNLLPLTQIAARQPTTADWWSAKLQITHKCYPVRNLADKNRRPDQTHAPSNSLKALHLICFSPKTKWNWLIMFHPCKCKWKWTGVPAIKQKSMINVLIMIEFWTVFKAFWHQCHIYFRAPIQSWEIEQQLLRTFSLTSPLVLCQDKHGEKAFQKYQISACIELSLRCLSKMPRRCSEKRLVAGGGSS